MAAICFGRGEHRKEMMSSKRKPGRPTKLTPEVRQTIVTYLKAGNYVETAAAAAGINKDTIYEWLKRGANEGKGIYKEFSDAVEKALAEGEILAVNSILRADEKQWQARAWWLERRCHERWGRKERVDLKVEGKVQVDHGLAESALEKIRGAVDKAELAHKEEEDGDD